MFPLVYFVRHGQTDWNAEQRLQGQADIDLNALGRVQAARNGRKLRELVGEPQAFDFVASPLRRTRETMEIARAAMGLSPREYRTDPRLIEVHFGDWQGHTFAELDALRPGTTMRRAVDKWHFVPPGEHGESYAMLSARVAPWFAELSQADGLRHPWRRLPGALQDGRAQARKRSRGPGCHPGPRAAF